MIQFTVIIPTMWRSTRIVEMLRRLSKCKRVSEIIIVDNDRQNRLDIEITDKMVILEQEKNIFVNPAWNLAVSHAKEDYICIMNDDITFKVIEAFDTVSSVINSCRCIGLHANSFKNPKEVEISKGHHIGRGWGCCMFMTKEGWVDIPEEVKIWYGDTWIAKKYDPVWSISFNVLTEMSTTSSAKDMNDIVKKDMEIWNSMSREN